MDLGDVLRYGLYVITVGLGTALVLWVYRSRQLHLQQREVVKNVQRAEPAAGASRRVLSVPSRSMADAIAGIRLPVHWQPDPPVEVVSSLTLTTDRESAGKMASMLSDELVRLGYGVRPTGARSARAVRDSNSISIEIEASDTNSCVSSRLTLTSAARV
ncbi:MAG: hypothetical protein ACN4GZ_00970 [Acidimicrobiales bacterium]